jgi:hypothetical protein
MKRDSFQGRNAPAAPMRYRPAKQYGDKMDPKILADGLRQRLRKKGLVPEILKKISDPEIIESYVTCSHCGALFAGHKEINDAIAESNSVEEFLEITFNEPKRHRHDPAML